MGYGHGAYGHGPYGHAASGGVIVDATIVELVAVDSVGVMSAVGVQGSAFNISIACTDGVGSVSGAGSWLGQGAGLGRRFSNEFGIVPMATEYSAENLLTEYDVVEDTVILELVLLSSGYDLSGL